MRCLIDTDILIDLALGRAPFERAAGDFLDYCQSHQVEGFIAWHSVANFYYLVVPKLGKKSTKGFISDLLDFVQIAPAKTQELRWALSLDMSDFEDALQVAAAQVVEAHYLVTRNIKHYKKSPIPAYAPQDLLKQLLLQ